MEFFKFHAIIYVRHVLYTLKKNWFSSTMKKKFSLDFVEFSRRALYPTFQVPRAFEVDLFGIHLKRN